MLVVMEFLCGVYIDSNNIWHACVTAFTANTGVLQHSPLVLIYCKGATIISGTPAYSQAKDSVWGIVLVCTNPTCATQSGEVYSKTHKVHKAVAHSVASWLCTHCSRTSDRFERPDWITEVLHKLTFFSHDYLFESKASTLANECTWH